MSALDAELWVWYPITLAVAAARMISRRMLYGSLRKMHLDDFLMLFALATYTTLLVSVRVLSYTKTNLVDPNDPTDVITANNTEERIFGSKMVIVVEQMQVVTIWTVKACLLIMYGRLTTSLKQNYLVKIVAVYVVVGFIVMEILFFAVWCRPFWHYWQVPSDNIQCSDDRNHLITNAVLNISSDIMIISLPMPVFLNSQLPFKKKAILCTIFALGVFTTLCAILNKYYSFSDTYGSEWIFWYIREASTAIIVANLPLTWTLLQGAFNLRSFNGRSTGPRTGDRATQLRSAYGNLTSRTRSEAIRGEVKDMDTTSPSESQERIHQTDSIPLKIYQQNEVLITTKALGRRDEHETPTDQIAAGAYFEEDSDLHDSVHGDNTFVGESSSGGVTTVCHGP